MHGGVYADTVGYMEGKNYSSSSKNYLMICLLYQMLYQTFYFNLSYENFNSKKLSLGKELQYLKLEKKQIFFRTLTV